MVHVAANEMPKKYQSSLKYLYQVEAALEATSDVYLFPMLSQSSKVTVTYTCTGFQMKSNQLLVDYMLGDLELCDHFCLSVFALSPYNCSFCLANNCCKHCII